MAAICGACQESLADRCAREAQEYTRKNCPAPIGPNTTIDSLTFDNATLTLHYYYSLSGAADDSATVRQNNPRERLLQQIKNETSMKVYKDEGYRFAYTYRSASTPSVVLFETVFTKKDYQ